MDIKLSVRSLAGFLLIMIPVAAILRAGPIFADGNQSPQMAWAEKQEVDANSLSHARCTLERLQGRLNLAPEQMVAWNIWSAGMIEDCQRQLARAKNVSNEPVRVSRGPLQITVSERISHDIDGLRAQVASMEDQMSKLEASKVRTAAFYDTLDPGQRITFDAFWNERLDNHSGHNLDENLHEHRYQRPIT
jgi:hypothetical protein